MNPDVTISPSGPEMLPDITVLFDSAIAWLNSKGRSGQWGSKPVSEQPKVIDIARNILETSEVFRAAILNGDGQSVTSGIIAISENRPHPEVIPPPSEPAMHIQVLIADVSNAAARGVGKMLVERAKARTIELGMRMLRVDCYAGGDQRLVKAYEAMGFVRNPEKPIWFNKDYKDEVTPTQILEMKLGEA